MADEPTGNLDENTGRGIHDLLERWCEERKLTVMVVTHNPRLAERMPLRFRLTADGIEQGMLDVKKDVDLRQPPTEKVTSSAAPFAQESA